MPSAVKYFLLAYQNNPQNYIAPLYSSYCYENIGDIKSARHYIKKARSLKPKDRIIVEEYKALYSK